MPQVYKKDSPEFEYVKGAILAGVSPNRIEETLVLAKLFDKKPLEIQSMWMDAHVGIMQVHRIIQQGFYGGQYERQEQAGEGEGSEGVRSGEPEERGSDSSDRSVPDVGGTPRHLS